MWNANNKKGWFEIDLRRICALDEIKLFWADGKKPKSVKITYKVGSGQETEVFYRPKWTAKKVPLEMDCGTTVRVQMSGGGEVLKGVKACGVSYSTKDILKVKVNQAYEYFDHVRPDLIGIIDSMTYED